MKNTFSLLTATAALLLLGSTSQGNPQYQATGADGITASPKVRQFLDERRATATPAITTPTAVAKSGAQDVVASPKARQLLSERRKASRAPAASSKAVGYSAFGGDGIVASPKLRQILAERQASFELAPLK